MIPGTIELFFAHLLADLPCHEVSPQLAFFNVKLVNIFATNDDKTIRKTRTIKQQRSAFFTRGSLRVRCFRELAQYKFAQAAFVFIFRQHKVKFYFLQILAPIDSYQ